MSILKHSSSKNTSYGDALRYLKYKHKEDTSTGLYEPILDDYGLLQERDNYALCYLNGYGQERDPEEWVGACMETNIIFGKNNTKGERKQHIYIISHPKSDSSLLTKESLIKEGKLFVRNNLQGYDALIAVHMDTDNFHIHIAINSVRAVERPQQSWMMHNDQGKVLRSEVCAGGKHQDNPNFRHHCQDWLLEYSRSHGLTIADNNRIERERKQKRFSEKHSQLKSITLSVASKCSSIQELRQRLKTEHNIDFIRRGNTYSLRLPNSKKAIRLSTIDISNDFLYSIMSMSPQTIREQSWEDSIQIEKKQYIQWLRERRLKNSAKAEDTIADAAALITRHISSTRASYSKLDFLELHDLIKQTTYLQRDLQTELDKIDRLLERWKLYNASDTLDQEKASHGNYIQWCGCKPDSSADFQDLQTERDVLALQIQETVTIREALVDSAVQWNTLNDDSRFHYQQTWTLSREAQLKRQLEEIKANRRKLGEIAYNCQKAANRRIYNQEYLKKAEYFRQMWHDKLDQEIVIKKQLRKVQQERTLSKKACPSMVRKR